MSLVHRDKIPWNGYHPRRLKTRETDLPGVLIVEPRVFRDERGWFMETFNDAAFAQYGLPTEFAQDNHSFSVRGVIRGLHYQLDPPQGKLVRCTRGSIFDVAVDIRRGSPTFGKWTGVELSTDNHLMLWVPAGFAHGFAALTDEADVLYKCTTRWNPQGERCIVWNDPGIGIEWPAVDPIVSTRDAAAPPLEQAEIFTPA
jgi:dTDP-4-dehydrorhamnose 3,5-epimerase